MTLDDLIRDMRDQAAGAQRRERILFKKLPRWWQWALERVDRNRACRDVLSAHWECRVLIAASNRVLRQARFEALRRRLTVILPPGPGGKSFLAPLQPTASQVVTSAKRRSRRK